MPAKAPTTLSGRVGTVATVVGWPLIFFSLAYTPIQRLRKSDVLFSSLTAKGGHETKFWLMRCVEILTEDFGENISLLSRKKYRRHSKVAYVHLCSWLPTQYVRVRLQPREETQEDHRDAIPEQWFTETLNYNNVSLIGKDDDVSAYTSITKEIILLRTFVSLITMSHPYKTAWNVHFCLAF